MFSLYLWTYIVEEKYFITHNPGQLPCFSKQLFNIFFFFPNWNEVGLQNTRKRNIYISVHLYSSWRSQLVDPGTLLENLKENMNPRPFLGKHCRWTAEGRWRAVTHAFLVMHIIPANHDRLSHGYLPWDGQCFLAEVLGGRELSLHFFLCCKWRNGVASTSEKTKEKIDNRYERHCRILQVLTKEQRRE